MRGQACLAAGLLLGLVLGGGLPLYAQAPLTASAPAPAAAKAERSDVERRTAPGDAQEDEALRVSESAATAVERAPAATVLLVPSGRHGRIAPAVGALADRALQRAARATGYGVLSIAGDSPQLKGEARPATLLWSLGYVEGAHRALSAELRANDGRYVFVIRLASLDGQGPFEVRGQARADGLVTRIYDLARSILPPPDAWWDAPLPPSREAILALRKEHAHSLASPARPPAKRPRAKRHDSWRHRRLHAALTGEATLALTEGRGVGGLVGARADFRFTRSLLVGAGLAYANQKGRLDRAHSLASYGQLEYRSFFSKATDVSLPLRLRGGFLVNNGPFVGGALGANVPLGERFELGVDLVAPTVWFVPGGNVVSLSFGAELITRWP